VRFLLSTAHRWSRSLQFRITALAVLTGILSALGTAAAVLHSAEQSIRRVVLVAAQQDREHSATVLASKVTVLSGALAAVARRVPVEAWSDAPAMGRHLADKPALASLFTSLFAVAPDGRMVARVEGSVLTGDLPSVADREYFRRAMASDQPVISEALWGKVLNAPVVVFAVPVLDNQGRHLGVLAGSLALQSTALFDEQGVSVHSEAARDMVVDRSGRILAHSDAMRLMQPAVDDPGLREAVNEWLSSGSPIETKAVATLRGEHVVAMAGIPLTDWITVRVTRAAEAFSPVAEARAAALPAALIAGLTAGLAAGILGYVIARPISRLRARAESLLQTDDAGASRWPEDVGEIGQLARAFRHVVEQRVQRQSEVQALLHQLEAVLDHAEVGIALTRNGRFELVSRHFCHIFRCEKDEAIGQATRIIYPNDAAFEALAREARPALSQRGVLDTELELMRRTGQLFWARMRGRAVVAGDVNSGTIWTIEDVTAAREQREQLAYSASHDSLTGLLNRSAFESMLEATTREAGQASFCALFIDLDRFKQVNDTGGHAAGDALLRDVAKVLVESVRKSDTVARLGGDEFAVLLPHCSAAHARTIAAKLCGAVQQYELHWEGDCFSVGASVGLVPVDAGFNSAADVLRAADSACYLAKKRGRSRVEQYVVLDHQEYAPEASKAASSE
jgi:diguanylate cyclase